MRFAVLQLTGCAGCEVSLLNAGDELDLAKLVYMPLLVSAYDVPEDVDLLLVTGGIRSDEDLLKLRESASKVKKIVAVGTCAISGGVAGLGDRHDIHEHFLAHTYQGRAPRMLPKCSPIDSEVEVDYYLPGCPPVPDLYVKMLNDPASLKTTSIVCKECGRKKPKDIRPTKLVEGVHQDIDPDLCLIKQGQLCVGTSTRNGCGAICPLAGFPCVGCRGPSNKLIEKDANAWFESLSMICQRMTDIDPEEINQALKSPHFALFLFQFSDYTGSEQEKRPKEKVL